MVLGELVNRGWVSAVAGSTGVAVDHHLRGQDHRGEGSVPHDVDSIGQAAGGPVSPAGSAVLGNVLVPGVRDVVDAIHVSPVESLGQVGIGLRNWALDH